MNEKKINYYLKKFNIIKNKNDYKNIINIYNYSKKKYNFDLTIKEKIILMYYYIKQNKYYGLIKLILIESIWIIFWIGIYKKTTFRNKINTFVNNYLQERHERNNPHGLYGLDLNTWKKINPILNQNFLEIISYINNLPIRNIIQRYIEKKSKIMIINKDVINRYLPMIIENFNNKIKFRKEIINSSREELLKNTKLPTEIINNILSFIDRIVIYK